MVIIGPPHMVATSIVPRKNMSRKDYSTGQGRHELQAASSLRHILHSGFLERLVRDESFQLRAPSLSRHYLSSVW
jgi:hypothetical protein